MSMIIPKHIRDYWMGWQTNRIKFISNHFPVDFFHNKKVLELAPFNGYIGNFCLENGAESVLAVEGREENIQNIKQDYPKLSVVQSDLDSKEWTWGKFDIIINFGLLYHLQNNHRECLINCINNCNIMFLESVIYDSCENEIHFRTEHGADQALSGVGGTPTSSYVENILKENNCKFERFDSQELDASPHIYSWADSNIKRLEPFNRRFWVVYPNQSEK